MGLLTLQNYRDDLEGALQRSGISSAFKDRWVNQSLKEFGYALKFHELEATAQFVTVDAQTDYAIGSGLSINITDFRAIDELRIVSSVSGDVGQGRILPETRSRYNRMLGDAADTQSHGVPRYYHRWRNRIWLRPIPDSDLVTVDMDYFKSLTGFAADASVSPLHEDWDEIIFVGALYRGFRHFGEYDRYQNVRNDFLGLIRSRQDEFGLEEFPEGGIDPTTDSEDELISG
jgi:hypothetical protein